MNKITKNIIIVVFTGIFNLTLSTILGFVVSRFFDYDNYAYYKMYFLYITFVGFAHLGFINGLYLEYGKYDYSKLPFHKFHTYFIILVILQILIMICAFPFILLSNSSIDKKIVLFFVFGNLPLININCFFALINQFTKRFTIDSIANIGKGALDFLMIILTLIGVFDNYLMILLFVLFENVVVLSINIFFNKKIAFTTGLKNENIFLIYGKYIKKGFFVMFSEFIGLIILEIDGLFAEHLFDLKIFAIYSFAATVISMFYAIISTVSNLIYPYLVRVDYDRLKNCYIVLSEIVLVISIVGMSMVYLVHHMIQIILPNYLDSIHIISILALTIPFKALIVLIDNNFFKVMKLSKNFFISNVFAIICSIVLNGIFEFIYFSSVSLAIASVVTIIIWYIFLEVYFIKKLECAPIKCYKKYFYFVSMLVGYYIVINRGIFIWSGYFILIIISAYLLFFEDIKVYVKDIRNMAG